MNQHAEELTRWVYQGVWRVLSDWFRVPQHPPVLPTQEGETVESFRPAEGFLRYLKLQFWIWLVVIDLAFFIGWIAITAASPVVGVLLALPALALAVVPDVVAYVAIHLRYDTTWYVMSDRSLRIRRGIWIIHETTITFENVQNVTLSQGPLQRWFGIGSVRVDTAGGGGHGEQGVPTSAAHQGLIEGIADAPRIRDLLMKQLRRSQSDGLGDEPTASVPTETAWSPEHLRTLREIRDVSQTLAGQEF